MRNYWVYILANKPRGTLYVGATSDLPRRVWQHKNRVKDGFTKSYGVDRLVWFEVQHDWRAARVRENRLKEWKRIWKIKLIEDLNPEWNDLYDSIVGRY